LNYVSGEALKANPTLTGVVLQATPVKVRKLTDNLVVGLPASIVDSFTGTDLATVELEGVEYVVRIDGTRYMREQLVTVVQGPNSKVKVGEAVFIIINGVGENKKSVRLVAATSPENYFRSGLREDFEKAGQQRSRIYNAQ
jgi:phage terminase large subunit-like protein